MFGSQHKGGGNTPLNHAILLESHTGMDIAREHNRALDIAMMLPPTREASQRVLNRVLLYLEEFGDAVSDFAVDAPRERLSASTSLSSSS